MASLLLLPARRLLQEPDSLLPSIHSFSNSSNSSADDDNPYGLNSRFNPSMAIIIAVLLSAFFFMGFFSVYIRRCAGGATQLPRGGNSNPARRADAANSRPGLDKAIVDGLPAFVFSVSKPSKAAKENAECVVCLSEFQDGEVLRLLPKCGHAFHQDCIDMWLFSHTTCPICRRSLLSEKVRSFRDLFTFGGSSRHGRDGRSGTLDHDQRDAGPVQASAQESVSDPDGAGEIHRAVPDPTPASRSHSGLARKLKRSNSTGHSSIKLQPPLGALPDDEESNDRSAVFRLPLLASDFHRSRSVSVMAYSWQQEDGSGGAGDLSGKRDVLNATASSSSSQPPLASVSSMRRTFMRLVGIERSPDFPYQNFSPRHS